MNRAASPRPALRRLCHLLAQKLTNRVAPRRSGECISVDGTHLGHNLPDGSGNRYCINLVSVAGKPV